MAKPTSHQLASKGKHHPRNKHRDGYNFPALKLIHKELSDYVSVNKYGNESIDFFDPKAVKALNTALLKRHYGTVYWEIPPGFLCPPIPGRADYIHHIADEVGRLLKIPPAKGPQIRCLDIGTGANCIYPIIANHEYGWSCVGSDIIDEAITAADANVANNPSLSKTVEIRKQGNPSQILKGVIKSDEYFDLAICNPPFHTSKKEALKGTLRKIKNLKGKAPDLPILNFGGKNHELWYEGGEKIFIKRYIHESKFYKNSCLIYSSLVSKERHLDDIEDDLSRAHVNYKNIIKMGQGNKSSHLVTWSFLNEKQVKVWRDRTSH